MILILFRGLKRHQQQAGPCNRDGALTARTRRRWLIQLSSGSGRGCGGGGPAAAASAFAATCPARHASAPCTIPWPAGGRNRLDWLHMGTAVLCVAMLLTAPLPGPLQLAAVWDCRAAQQGQLDEAAARQGKQAAAPAKRFAGGPAPRTLARNAEMAWQAAGATCALYWAALKASWALRSPAAPVSAAALLPPAPCADPGQAWRG